MAILAGDVGGTKTRLALYEGTPTTGLRRGVVEKFDSREASSLEDIIVAFLTRHGATGSVSAACFGIPGPVVKGTVRATNLPWVLEETKIATRIRVQKTKLVNDLVATISAIPTFSPEDLIVLHPGSPLS